MASFKFLHTADVHLDSPLRGLSRYEGVPARRNSDCDAHSAEQSR